jgi:hypothetical protein
MTSEDEFAEEANKTAELASTIVIPVSIQESVRTDAERASYIVWLIAVVFGIRPLAIFLLLPLFTPLNLTFFACIAASVLWGILFMHIGIPRMESKDGLQERKYSEIIEMANQSKSARDKAIIEAMSKK